MRPLPDPELLLAQPDIFSRHARAWTGIEHLRAAGELPECARILDVGGSSGLSRRFFPNDQVIVADILADGGCDVLLDGSGKLPLKVDEFDVAVSFDALEHVPIPDRATFVAELARVARTVVVLTVPNGTPAVEESEATLRAAHMQALDADHQWLGEHIEHGLPTRDELIHWTDATAMRWWFGASSPLATWPMRLAGSLAYEQMHDTRALQPLLAAWNQGYLACDGQEPGYRTIAVGAAPSVSAEAVSAAFAAGAEDPAAIGLAHYMGELVALGTLVSDLEQARSAAQAAFEVADADRKVYHAAHDALYVELEQLKHNPPRRFR